MFACAGSPLGCDCILNACLMAGDHVKLAFAKNNIFSHVSDSPVQSEEDIRLLENRSLRRVDVLSSSLIFPQFASAEGDDIVTFIVDGKHEAVAEADPESRVGVILVFKLGDTGV